MQNRIDSLSMQVTDLTASNEILSGNLSRAETNLLTLGKQKDSLSHRILYLTVDSLNNNLTINILQSIVLNLMNDSILLARDNERLGQQYNELLPKFNNSMTNLAKVTDEKKQLDWVWQSIVAEYMRIRGKDSLLIQHMSKDQRLARQVIDSLRKKVQKSPEAKSSKRLTWFEYILLLIPLLLITWFLFRNKSEKNNHAQNESHFVNPGW